MENNIKRGKARVLWDEFKVNNREIEAAVVKGLTEDGFDVEIVPDFKPGNKEVPPMSEGSTIKVYRRMCGYA